MLQCSTPIRHQPFGFSCDVRLDPQRSATQPELVQNMAHVFSSAVPWRRDMQLQLANDVLRSVGFLKLP